MAFIIGILITVVVIFIVVGCALPDSVDLINKDGTENEDA